MSRMLNFELRDAKQPVDRPERKIVRYDNLGDPIYEDELNAMGNDGISILGKKVPFDPLSASLLIFGLIAFQFFVLANL
jgi:hypothetical protein